MRVLTLFSGAGGMDLGFIQAGAKILWTNDFEKDATITYANNISDHIVHADITQISNSKIPYSDIDVIIGGFPCQDFSVANTKRSIKDERNFLYKELLRVVKYKQPKYFVGENVKGLLSLAGGKVFEMIKQDFKNLGYEINARLLNSADFGVPQFRQRVIIIGNRIGKKNIFPSPTHTFSNDLFNSILKTSISTKDVIGYLYDIDTVEKNTNQVIQLNNKKIHNHISYTNVSDKFFGRKHKVIQADVCDYLKYWRNNKEISTKRVDEYFGYKPKYFHNLSHTPPNIKLKVFSKNNYNLTKKPKN